MGARLLYDWLSTPLADRGAIEARLDALGELAEDSGLRQEIRQLLHELAEKLPNLRNYNVAVHEGPAGIVFLHKIAPGSTDKSYGIHVAQLAGIPEEVLLRARQVLAELEARHVAVPEVPHATGPHLRGCHLLDLLLGRGMRPTTRGCGHRLAPGRSPS